MRSSVKKQKRRILANEQASRLIGSLFTVCLVSLIATAISTCVKITGKSIKIDEKRKTIVTTRSPLIFEIIFLLFSRALRKHFFYIRFSTRMTNRRFKFRKSSMCTLLKNIICCVYVCKLHRIFFLFSFLK